jgi:hypothetical protein
VWGPREVARAKIECGGPRVAQRRAPRADVGKLTLGRFGAAIAQVLHLHDAARELVVAEDERMARPARIGLLELRLEAGDAVLALRVHEHRDPGRTQRFGRRHGRHPRRLAADDRVDVRRVGRRRDAGRLEQQQQPFDAQAPTHRGRRLAAQHLEQAVVAPAAAHGALRTELVGDPLEDGEVVVVHAAHQARVDRVRQADRIEHGAHGIEVRQRLRTEEVHQLGRRLDQRLHRRVLAVEDAQRVRVQPPLRLFVQHGGVRFEVGDQRRPVRVALGRLAEAVELEPDVFTLLQPELAQQRAREQDLLGVHIGADEAERFDVQLVELAIAALLRPLVAEHRTHRPQAQRPVVQRVVLDHRAHDAGGRLGPQGQPVAVHRVLEGIHLLLDDVGDLAQAAHEQRRGLDDRGQQVLVPIALQHGAHRGFEPLPHRRAGQRLGRLARDRRREDVVHAFDGTQDFRHGNT